MLGRLRMSVKDCKTAYLELSRVTFTEKNIVDGAASKSGLVVGFKMHPIVDAICKAIGLQQDHLGVDPKDALLKDDSKDCYM